MPEDPLPQRLDAARDRDAIGVETPERLAIETARCAAESAR